MIRRPKPGEDEEDILKMQEEFLRAKNQNRDLQPAAQVINLRAEAVKRPSTSDQGGRRPSKYAQSKGLKNHSEKRTKTTHIPEGSVLSDIHEKNTLTSDKIIPEVENDKVYYPKIIPSILGNIVEKNLDAVVELGYKPMPSEGFPVASKHNVYTKSNKSIFKSNSDKCKQNAYNKMDIEEPSCSNQVIKNLPNKSYILTSNEANDIHNENVKVLSKMSEKDILDEQQKLFSSLDPKLIEFIKSKRMQNNNITKNPNSKPSSDTNMDVEESNEKTKNLSDKSYIFKSEDSPNIHKENFNILTKMSEKDIQDVQQKIFPGVDPKLNECIKSKGIQSEELPLESLNKNKIMETDSHEDIIHTQGTSTQIENDTLWENDILSHPEINSWLHFDALEKHKLEWMKGIEESKKIKPDEPYEARFNFKGYLLPYTIEYTDATKSLFHHGEDPHRPGYTLMELIELTRSTVTQQRVMALNTIAGILEYLSAGTYKDIVEIPISKLFFVIRIAMDENKATILEPGLKAMRNLLYNRIDEASLDALIGFEEGNLQPCLENDKSEIEELESKESELKDFHLAEIDLIAAALRTDIIQRLYYILEIVRPSFNSVQYCLQILTRLARDSVETANQICQAEHLMKSIITHFVPTTGVNFVFDSHIVYNGKPVLAALKLLRVLTLQTKDISNSLLTKYDILAPISVYISSAVDRSYGLRIQTESHCVLSNLLYFELGYESALSLSPVILTALYKHVQGTNINVEASVLSVTHAAVVLQLINNLLKNNLNLPISFKTEIYKLLKDGVLKWLGQLSQMEHYTCAHLRILCSALDCCNTIILIEDLPIKFLNDALKQFAISRGFQNVIKNLTISSNLLSKIDCNELYSIKNLMTLKCSVIDSEQKVLPVMSITSPIPFLMSFFKLLTTINNKDISITFLEHIWHYLKSFSKCVPSLTEHWFTRMEINLVFYILKLSNFCDIEECKKDVLFAVANKLCYVLRVDKKYELDFLFQNIVFNKEWFTAERLLNLVNLSDADGFSKALTAIEDIKQCYNTVVNCNYKDTGFNVMLKKWMEPILPRDWIYLPILLLYSKNQEVESIPQISGDHAKKIAAQIAIEKEFIITCSLEWILFNELCFSDLLNDIDVTDKFCRIMCVFLCDNSLFLQPKIQILLVKCTSIIFKYKSAFNFDKQLSGLNNFQDFYTQFLEQFQAVSYGDNVFAACVLVPLAQKHNVKWRKLLWSEYAGCLRALDCPEQYLCYQLNNYLYPEETDESLIKSYHRALSTNLLRPGTIVHKIASHHVEKYKKRSDFKNS